MKASHHGVCSWSKCSNVYHPQADNSGVYYDCGVYFGRAKIYISYNRKVNGLMLHFCIYASVEIYRWWSTDFFFFIVHARFLGFISWNKGMLHNFDKKILVLFMNEIVPFVFSISKNRRNGEVRVIRWIICSGNHCASPL